MIPRTLLILISGLFIAWIFNSLVGIIGLSFVLVFYWTVYLKARQASRKKIMSLKKIIVEHFHNLSEKAGEEHFRYLYLNSQQYLNFRSSLTFALTNYVVKIGTVIIGFYSIWNSDWISLIACIIFGSLTTILSLKYERHFKNIVSSRSLDDEEYEKFAYTLNSYTEFFKERFPESYYPNVKSNDNEYNSQ